MAPNEDLNGRTGHEARLYFDVAWQRVTHRIKEDQTVRTDEVDTTSSSFGTQQKDELFAFGIIEASYNLRALVHIHGAIQTDAAIPVLVSAI
jgi:hypothetical protein